MTPADLTAPENPTPSLIVDLFKNRLGFYIAIYALWFAAVFWFTDGPKDFPKWVDGWHRWDAVWYFRIWNEGYGKDPTTLVFPPGFSWITGSISEVTRQPFNLIALILNTIFFFVGSVAASELIGKRFQVPVWWIFVFQLSYPAAFYAFMPYSDALFYAWLWLLMPIALANPKTLHWGWKAAGGIGAFFAPWIRITGYALLIWAAFRRWFAASVLATLGLYVTANYLVTKQPFYFLDAQRVFKMPRGYFFTGLVYHLQELFDPPSAAQPTKMWLWLQSTVLPVASTLLLVGVCVWLVRRKEWLLLATVVAIAAFSRNQAFWRSVFRYDWPLVAILILPVLMMAKHSARRSTRIFLYAALSVFMVVSFLLQLALAIRLNRGGWGF